MAAEAPTLAPQTAPTTPRTTRSASTAHSSIQMARMPLLALAVGGRRASPPTRSGPRSTRGLNAGPLVVVCFGMILAAFIDGWALKVPNWVTLPLVLSGWMLGLLHDFGRRRRRRHRRASGWPSWARCSASSCFPDARHRRRWAKAT